MLAIVETVEIDNILGRVCADHFCLKVRADRAREEIDGGDESVYRIRPLREELQKIEEEVWAPIDLLRSLRGYAM